MAGDWNAQRMHELGTRHLQLEAERQIDALLETLVPTPAFDFHPLGLRLRGRERIRRYFEQYFRNFMHGIEAMRQIEEWGNADSLAQECDISVRVDAELETYRVITVLPVDRDKQLLTGRRVFASERAIKLMLGEFYSELEPLD